MLRRSGGKFNLVACDCASPAVCFWSFCFGVFVWWENVCISYGVSCANVGRERPFWNGAFAHKSYPLNFQEVTSNWCAAQLIGLAAERSFSPVPLPAFSYTQTFVVRILVEKLRTACSKRLPPIQPLFQATRGVLFSFPRDMSRGKNSNTFRRGNKTLAWYMDSKVSKVLDRNDTQGRGTLFIFNSSFSSFNLDNALSPALHRRKNSFDSESSLNSNGRQTANEADERKRRANKARTARQRSQNSQTFGDQNEDTDRSDSIVGSAPNEHPLVGSEQQAVAFQQHFLALSAQATADKGRENYWYYDANSDGYFYEFCGSRGWRKRNPKLHGNVPVPAKANEETVVAPGTQTIEKVIRNTSAD